MFTWQNLFVGLVTGCIGYGYFRYGKKQGRLVFLVTGIALMVYPYIFSSLVVQMLVGIGLIVIPFVVK